MSDNKNHIHMKCKLGMTPDEVVKTAIVCVAMARGLCDDIEFSCEDGSRTSPEFLCRVLKAVIDAGATTVNIPDIHAPVRTTGIEAADVLEKERFDLILFDVMLPGADGFELLARVEMVLRRYHNSNGRLK